jgi:hypothetical protein
LGKSHKTAVAWWSSKSCIQVFEFFSFFYYTNHVTWSTWEREKTKQEKSRDNESEVPWSNKKFGKSHAKINQKSPM